MLWAALAGSGCASGAHTLSATPRVARSEHVRPMEKAALSGTWIEPLFDPAGKPAGMITIPLGAREPRPVIVAMHAASGRPDWMCGTTRDIAGPRPFVVCPHPIAEVTRMASWGDGPSMRLALERAMGSAMAKYAAYMRLDDIVYFGHSQSAMHAGEALAASPRGTVFHSVLLYEGAPASTREAANMLKGAGVSRALVVSGQEGWASAHRSLAVELARLGVEARYVHAGGDHYFAGPAIPSLRENLRWLVRGSGAWEAAR